MKSKEAIKSKILTLKDMEKEAAKDATKDGQELENYICSVAWLRYVQGQIKALEDVIDE